MPEIGRNEPCPCGSGKKYKRCCLPADEAEERRWRAIGAGLARALDWLFEHHGPAVEAAIDEGFFGMVGSQEVADLVAELPERLLDEMLQINLNEWLLADAEIEVAGAPRRVAELLLDSGPPLDADARARIAELARRPLGLYEVAESQPGVGLWLRDALDPAAPRLWVAERIASQSLLRLSIFGGRLIEEGGGWILSGAVYPLPRVDLLVMKDHLRERLGGEEDSGLIRSTVTRAILDAWLEWMIEAGSAPDDDGDPVFSVTDRYRVDDWERLSAALAEESEVEGSREEGWIRWGWDGEEWDVLLSLTPAARDLLEVCADTERLGDEGRGWLLRVAGDSVAFLTSEVGAPSDPPASAEPEALPAMSRQERTEIGQRVCEEYYGGWPDEPIPALDDETPRQALRSPRGRERVVDLLKLYEHEELHAAVAEDREPARLQFLWDALELDRDRLLG